MGLAFRRLLRAADQKVRGLLLGQGSGERTTLRGRYRVRHLDAEGRVLRERVYDNVVCSAGKTIIAQWLNQEIGAMSGVYGAVGTAGNVFWQPSTSYPTLYAVTQPNPNNGYFYEVVQPGTSGGTAPAWPTTIGGQVVDGTVKWSCVGPTASDTQLYAELSPRQTPVSQYVSANSWVVDFLWPMAQVNGQLTEIGLFIYSSATANAATLLSHCQINENKASTSLLDVEFTLTIGP